jgi:hypothetical protein
MVDLQNILRHARSLHGAGLVPIPLCCPLGTRSGCSSPNHHATTSTNANGTTLIVPCPNIGKRPLIRGFPHWAASQPSWAEVRGLLLRRAPCNLGIVTGAVIVVETDSTDAEVEVQALGGHALLRAPTRERRGGRGRAWVFAGNSDFATNRAHLGKSAAIDVRGHSGLFVVPPSEHVTGHRYEWLPGLAPWETPPPPMPSQLESLFARATRVSATAPALDISTMQCVLPPSVAFRIKARLQFGRLWRSEGKGSGDCSASGYDFTIACELIRDGVPDRDVVAALSLRPGVHRRDIDYLRRTVARARAFR